MSSPSVSVVIPTRNRCSILKRTLESLASQRGLLGTFEVVVADDGSTDSTLQMLDWEDWPFFLRRMALEHGGPARARNRGISVASGERVLLLGDDTIPEPGCVAAHVSANLNIGVQGMIDWDPEVGVTDVMKFLAPEGPQFWFKGLRNDSRVPWSSVVSSNLSAPREWFITEPFDEGFSEASMEDTELSWRWRRRGWQVVFSDNARCLHRHRYDEFEDVLRRQQRAGRWARRAVRLQPGLLYPVVLRPIVLAPLIALRGALKTRSENDRSEWRWELRCRLAFASGFLFGRPSDGRGALPGSDHQR
jgi:glycosyltransferase involved in cell wall biosynthesis